MNKVQRSFCVFLASALANTAILYWVWPGVPPVEMVLLMVGAAAAGGLLYLLDQQQTGGLP